MRHKITPLMCLLSGALMVLSMAPWNLWPFMFAGFSAFYFLLTTASTKRRAFFYGWLFGFGYFACGLWWIANALLVPGNPFSWVWPLAVAGLPALLAFFPACAALAIKRFSNPQKISGFLLFVSLMSLSEWLRGHIFTGFPWNLYGYSWGGWDAMMQNAAWGGPYMLTLLTVFWATLPGFVFISNETAARKTSAAILAVLLFAGCLTFGQWRISGPDPGVNDNMNLLIVQPDIHQEDKWENAKAGKNLYTLSLLSGAQNDDKDKTTIILWPETAITADALTNPQARAIIKPALESYAGSAYLLTGLLRFETRQDKVVYFNSVAAVDRNLGIAAVYDKAHLVPFGEYIPFQKIMPFGPFVQFEGFTQGSGPMAIALPGAPAFSALICYEIIFPGAVVNRKGPRPAFILNVTNDAWYGDSPGPRQHFMQARFRAVEEGLPVVRSANTGVSGLIDAYGRPLLTMALNSKGAENVSLPHSLPRPPLYTRAGDWIFLAAALGLILPSRRRRS